MNLVLDFGNTLWKVALFEGGHLKLLKSFQKGELSVEVLNEIAKSTKKGILSSVVHLNQDWEQWMTDNHVIVLSHETPLPIINKYATPETLGKDRLANAIGLFHHFPNEHSISVDFGTCVKIDFVSKQGHYLGGSISPGLQMRYKSLQKFTDKLPLVEHTPLSPLIGTDTASSIRAGVFRGIIYEIEGVIKHYKEEFGPLEVIFTGGDSEHFEPAFKNTIFARPNLTLEGLNKILDYNG
ncbi:MAG: type III pantothenate kinase [Flavobacteriales bacterium]|nr:type III pantothenate kinase [Flavobacteriales bacterium]